MKQDKLRNLLNSAGDRLSRVEKSIGKNANEGDSSEIGRLLRSLKAEVARHRAKTDALKITDVDEFERQVALLREAAAEHIHRFGPNSSLVSDLRSILRDNLGLMNIAAGMRIGLSQIGPDEMIEAVPGQKPAAYQFKFDDKTVVLYDPPFYANEREAEIAFASLQVAVEHGEYVAAELARTNVAPRLVEAFSTLQRTLESHKNIVQVGMRAQFCSRLLHADADELSPTIFGMMIGHLEMVSSTLAQFEEWRIFSENSVAVSIDPASYIELADSTRALVKQLREINGIDPAVSEALGTVAGWVDEGKPADRRDILAAARTVENFWSIVTRCVLSVARETVSEARKMVAKAILAVILITASAGMIQAMGGVPGAQWIETAYKYFKANPVEPGGPPVAD